MMGSELFEGIHYYVVEENVKDPANVKRIMKEGGASREFYMGELVTHVISDVPVDLETSSQLAGQEHLTMHSDWVVMSQKCEGRLPTAPFELDGGKLFSGLNFCPSKLSISDVEKLCALLLYHGGKMQRRLDSKVTHLITMETRGAKYECARNRRSVKVVSPDWVIDSVEANSRLDAEKYHPLQLRRQREEATDRRVSMESCNGAVLVAEDIPMHPVGASTRTPTLPKSDATPTEATPTVAGEAGKSSQVLVTEVSVPEATEVAVQQVPRPSETAAPTTTTKTDEEKATPTTPNYDELLDGVVLYFTDYQDCVEADTLDKWKLVVRQHGGQVQDSYDSNTCSHLLALHKMSTCFAQAFEDGKCIASAHWLNDVLTEQKMFPPRNPIHFPTAFQWQLPNADIYSMTLTNYTDSERELVKDMMRICGLPYTGHLSKENTHLICKRPEGRKYEKALEWGVQVVNGIFLADIIHTGQLPAALLPRYTLLNEPNEFDPRTSSKASRILELWKPFLCCYANHHPDLLDSSVMSSLVTPKQETANPVGGKRGLPEDTTQDSVKDKIRKVEAQVPRTSQRLGVRPIPVVTFTGIGSTVVRNLTRIVVRLGGVVTTNPKECTHLVTSRIARTIKFLSAISVCGYVVTPRWVEESGKAGIFRDEEQFLLRDPEAEQLFGMKLATSLSRARSKKLLEGMGVYATPTVEPPSASLSDIVSCGGGRLLSHAEVRSVMAAGGRSDLAPAGVVVLSTGTDIENNCCKEFTRFGIKVYNAELILTGVLKQELEYTPHTFSTD